MSIPLSSNWTSNTAWLDVPRDDDFNRRMERLAERLERRQAQTPEPPTEPQSALLRAVNARKAAAR